MENNVAPHSFYSPQATLDNLYSTALESVSNWDSEDFVKDFRMILGTIIAAKDPLSSTAIDQLLEMPPEQPSMHTISRLACVLSQGPVVRVLHPSFADFLCTRTRCSRDIWFIDPIIQNRALAIQCLHLLNGLTMNSRNLTLSADLQTEAVPEGMTYACVFWTDHICRVEEDIRPVLVHLDTFLNTLLLHWFEVMSILKRSRDTILLLDKLSIWIITNTPDQISLRELIRDSCRFAQTFANSIEEHTLLVYFDALSFSPLTSAIYSKFHHNTLLPSVIGGFEQSWSPLLLTFAGHGGPVTSAVFSPDGTRIISGSHDKTVRVVDVQSGVEVVPAMRGHKGFVLSISCSPDGTRIASGSDDMTICVWGASSGTEIVWGMHGHRDWILSVAFSCDGIRIVSGSRDNTIRIWDALSGVELVPALVGHQDSVHSAVFSPDDSRIVSSSRDTTIRVWDALTRKEVFPAICGHDSFVFSVAFSPDGTPVVSGSTNNIIRIWDALSGAEIVTAVHDHQDLFFSVMLSPDGTRVIAHSSDGTDIGWDAASGIQLFAVSSNPTTISTPRLFSPRTIEVNSDGWLVHVPTNRTVSKLPTILTPLCSASHGTSLAIGTQGGQVIIMTFPLAVFTRSETRPAPGRGRQRRELQYDSLA